MATNNDSTSTLGELVRGISRAFVPITAAAIALVSACNYQPTQPANLGQECISHPEGDLSLGCYQLAQGMSYPVDSRSMVSDEGFRRHPYAIDAYCFKDGVHGREGNPVYAGTHGKVVKINYNPNNGGKKKSGLYVTVRFPNSNLLVSYMHLQYINSSVRVGMEVTPQTELGGCGRTGIRRSLAHLHLQFDRETVGSHASSGQVTSQIRAVSGQYYPGMPELQIKDASTPEEEPSPSDDGPFDLGTIFGEQEQKKGRTTRFR